MKTIISSTDEAMELINQISQFDDVSMMSIICALIDKVSARSKKPVIDIVAGIVEAVIAVNEALGPYWPDTGEGHDHKN